MVNVLSKGFWNLILSFGNNRELYERIVSAPVSYTEKDRKKFKDKERVFLERVLKDVKFYRDRVKKENPKLKDFPMMTRPSFKEYNNAMLADEYIDNLKDYQIDLNSSVMRNLYRVLFAQDYIFNMSTGGTSGDPLICHKNKMTMFTDGLLFMKGWKMMGYELSDRVLIFYDSYYNYDLSWVNALAKINGLKLFFFEKLDEDKVRELVDEINRFKPKILVSFPSYVNYAARIIEEKGLEVKHSPLIEVSGENLFPHQRKNAERAFKTKVYDSYGSLELGMIAHECEHQNGLHIYEDIINIETKKHKGKDAVMATRYDTESWPILNYLIGDLGKVVDGKCKCGRRGKRIKAIHGRVEDYVLLPDKSVIYPTFFRQMLDYCNEQYENVIIESQIVQRTRRDLVLKIITRSKTFNSKISNHLEGELKKMLPKSMRVEIKFVKDIPNRRKFRFVERSFK
jgi:phenylacetate-CoA ligase